MKSKIPSKTITLGKKELQRIKDLCQAFNEIVEVADKPSCFGNYVEGYDRYYKIVEIIQNFNDNWG